MTGKDGTGALIAMSGGVDTMSIAPHKCGGLNGWLRVALARYPAVRLNSPEDAVSRKFDISLNIIFADITIVQDAPIGGTAAVIRGERAQITAAVAYLIEKNVGVGVIKDAGAAG